MLPSDICRTCAVQNNRLLPLSTCLDRDASKSYYAVLQELTQIDLESSDDNLPQHLCTECWTRMESAYAFVQQAKKVNGELLARLRECLDEMPIDIPAEQNIKTEVDLDDGNNKSGVDVDATETAALELKWRPESGSDQEFCAGAESDEDQVGKKSYHLRRSSRKVKQPVESENEECKPSEPSPVKRRRGRPPGPAKSQAMTNDGRHACEVCGKTFSWYRDMQRHARIHFENASYVCDTCGKGFLRKDKYIFHLRCHQKREAKWKALQLGKEWRFAERLYSSGRLKRIECKLCGLIFQRMEELRIHLRSHADVETLVNLKKDSDVVREHFPGLPCDLDNIRQQICVDIADGHLEKYACVVNFHGYELGLSDSDEDISDLAVRIAEDFEVQDFDRYYNASTESGQELDLFESETELSDEETSKPSHICLLCGDISSSLTILMQHQISAHSDGVTELPCRCEYCGSGFVSKALLQQHRRHRCEKKHSRFHCRVCNIRFIWESNYEKHQQTHHNKMQDGEQQPTKLKCDQCEKVFIWHKDLNRHKRLHQPQSAAQFDCPHCHRRFHRKDGLKSHLKVHAGNSDYVNNQRVAPDVNQEMTLARLSRPHGCKLIQCMICLSRHSKIGDLRSHMSSHQYELSFTEDRDIPSVSRAFYPDLENTLERDKLAERIMTDVQKQIDLDRFISITNEAGLELNFESSETDTESEQEEDQSSQNYPCNLCAAVVKRKYQLYAHQLEEHKWEEAFLVCSNCQARFVNESLLDHHSRTLCHNPQKLFQCRKCPLRYRWRANLKLHMEVFHQLDELSIQEDSPKADGDLQCGKCQRSFRMQKDLTRHTLMHGQESNIFRCRWCARRFYRRANLLQHIARHGISVSQLPYAEAILDSYVNPGGRKKVECRVCNVSFPTIAALRLHLETMPVGSHHDYSSLQNYSITNQMGFEMDLDDSETDDEDARTHTKPPGAPTSYTCNMCQLRCLRKFELYQHQQAMHRMEKISDGCDSCLFKSVCPEIISHHKRTQCENREKQFTCTRCGYKFMWESNLLHHMELQHEKPEDQELDELKEASGDEPKAEGQVFQCGLCTRKYNRKDRLTAHLKKFHGPDCKPNPAKTSSRPISPKEPKRFLCAFCGKAVSSSSNLIIHMRRHTGEKPFKCEYCTMAFPRSSDLQCHRRTHTGERPHVCTVCQKGFARSYKLQQHMRIHSGERPYKCTYCEKSFTQSNDLTLHIRRHTGERPYQCGVCGERFIQGTALKNHRMQQSHYEEGQESGEPTRRTVLEQFTL
uniref:GG11398 n=1 Tax=Drosophila erecta TaxID=7220 RepID=B3P6K4_DROER